MLFVGLGRVLFIGPWATTAEHTPMVPIFGAGLDGDIHLDIAGDPFDGRFVHVPAGVPREVNAFGGRLAVMPFDPAHEVTYDSDEQQAIDLLCELAADPLDVTAWRALGDAVGLARLERVEQAVLDAAAFIDGHSDETVPGEFVAEAIGYSLSRLQELFRVQLGISMRSYRSWSRLRRFAALMASAPTLTAAAVGAGFYDAAHFSRVFMATFGVTASDVFTSDLRIQVVRDEVGL